MNPHLIVITGPSGVGKQTLIQKLRASMSEEGIKNTFSISTTTRKPRNTEQNGVDYHFCSVREFEEMISWQAFLEFANVHGNFYGTQVKPVTDALQREESVILDIDVQGATIVRKTAKERGIKFVDIFVAPPAPEIETLGKRLRLRRTDSEETIQTRLKNAEGELSKKDEFSLVVVNDDLSSAVLQCLDHIKNRLSA